MNQNKPAVVKKLQERFRNVSVGRGLYMAFMMPTMLSMFSTRAFAADTIWTKASAIMQDVYKTISGPLWRQLKKFRKNCMSILTQPEGLITGTAVKMFTVAGPVIVFGTAASVVYGLVLWLVQLA